MKKVIHKTVSILQGVSTLDTTIRKPRIILLLLISVMALVGAARGGHSTLDLVDPSFSPQIETGALTAKRVDQIISLADGKILVLGRFNTFNNQPVSGLVRLNANGTLDTTFNSNLGDVYGLSNESMTLQADGKILVRLSYINGEFDRLIRLNADGSLDLTFNFPVGLTVNALKSIAIDANGRIIVPGGFTENNIFREIIRLNSDGSRDLTFQFQPPLNSPSWSITSGIATQNNKIIISSNYGLQRLNEDGTFDSSFIQRDLGGRMIVQPDGKILLLNSATELGNIEVRRLNENGSDDTGFPIRSISSSGIGPRMALANDGRIILAIPIAAPTYEIRRYLADGALDASFTPYYADNFSSLAVPADGGVLIGDSEDHSPDDPPTPLQNDFVRLLPDGTPDPAFDTGMGFQTIVPGIVQTINVQPDSKILIGGDFDFVNGVAQPNITRINADSTLDTSFHINTNETGNYFLQIYSFSNIRTQNDGKIVATGDFDYVVNGVGKSKLVRLNSDGSIDPTFILGVQLFPDWNRFVTVNDGKLVVGTSRCCEGQPAVPVKLSATGERDVTFSSNLYSDKDRVFIRDIAVQPDGKILVGGRYAKYTNTPIYIDKSFLARLNADGSMDATFQPREQTDRDVSAFVLLPNGKIVLSESNGISNVLRLNSDGTVDPTFDSGFVDGNVNTMLLLSTGRIFVGGSFSHFNGQPRGNLVQLNENGSVFSPVYSLNSEVLSLAVDNKTGRVFVGGNFTTIIAGSSSANRTYVAGLIDAARSSAPFDFDGDGKSDRSVFRPGSGVWYLDRSRDGMTAYQWGLSTDKLVAADYDGDGITDLAVYRPSEGTWWIVNSHDGSVTWLQWGISTDTPVPADYDGDGKADPAVYRGEGLWFVVKSTGGYAVDQWGFSTDTPVPGDYDGDGMADRAIYRGDGLWFVLYGKGGSSVEQWGLATDIPVPADYDGDGMTDRAVYRGEGLWFVMKSGGGFSVDQWGYSTDIPVPADYDGDGMADRAVYRDEGLWFVMKSGGGFSVDQWGLSTDKVVPSALH